MTVYIVIFDRAAYQIGNKLFADIAAYIDDHYVDAHTDSRRERMRRMGVVESRDADRLRGRAHGALRAGRGCLRIWTPDFRRRC